MNPLGKSQYMGRLLLLGSCFMCIAIMALFTGCTTPGPGSATPVPTHPVPLYTAGDVLSGNMTLAGYDTPDPNVARYGAVVLGYQPGTDMYVYTFVEPLANGCYQYVLSEEWTAKFGRTRQEFEAYGLVKTGAMSQDMLWKVES